MCRYRVLLPLLLLLLAIPGAAGALQLRWSSGSTTLEFTSAIRCTLILEADSAEAALPASWRLLWVADSAGVVFVPTDSLQGCSSLEAQATNIDGPATAADSAAHLVTERFCSVGLNPANSALHVLELPAQGAGKLKVVALDASDPGENRIIASNEVTYNGGVAGDYSPVVLATSSEHQSLNLRVTAVGAGLSTVNSMKLFATDATWALPLAITTRGDGSVTGTASVAALLPECDASVGSTTGAVSAARLVADEAPLSEEPLSCQASYHEPTGPAPPPYAYAIQPKDFAFAKGFVDQTSNRFALHLFYIRHNYWFYQGPQETWQPDDDEKNIGHIWTTNLNGWYGPTGLNAPDTLALAVRAGKFDALHVMAPSIVQHGPVFHMFYTGVRRDVSDGPAHQRIGVATSTDLITWTQEDDAVLTAPNVPWAMTNPTGYPYYGAQQLRDPFVMEDPISHGGWLMYFVAAESCVAPCTARVAVGVARSTNLRTWTPLPRPFDGTLRETFQGKTWRVESPHVFSRHGRWWMPYTVGGDQVFLETTANADPAVTDSSVWTAPSWLRGVAEGQPQNLQYWHATEYLRINSKEYLAAFNDSDISIDIKGVFEPGSPAQDSVMLHCPEVAAVVNPVERGKRVRMTLTRTGWGAHEVGLRIELAVPTSGRLAVYDIAGRRVATIVDGLLPAGVSEFRWGGRDIGGGRVRSGVYFIRFAHDAGSELSKLVLIR